jgi:hypothetical protein
MRGKFEMRDFFLDFFAPNSKTCENFVFLFAFSHCKKSVNMLESDVKFSIDIFSYKTFFIGGKDVYRNMMPFRIIYKKICLLIFLKTR